MKGLSNYVCRRRLGERDRQRSLVAEPELDRILAFAAASQTGDRADLRELADDAPLWGEIAATPETRIGPRCAFFESCFVTAMRRRAAAAPLVHRQPPPLLRRPGDEVALARGAGAAPVRRRDLRRGPPARGRRDRVLRRARSTQRLFALARDLGRETGVDAQRAQAAAGRLKAATDALANALRDLAARRAPRRRGDPHAVPRTSRRARPSSATTSSTPASSRSPTGCDPDGDAAAALAAPARARGAGAAARPRCARICRCWSRAAGASTCAGWPPRPATSACTRRPSTSARCSGARSTPAPARSCSRPRR